jgi:hypothetical protein
VFDEAELEEFQCSLRVMEVLAVITAAMVLAAPKAV